MSRGRKPQKLTRIVSLEELDAEIKVAAADNNMKYLKRLETIKFLHIESDREKAREFAQVAENTLSNWIRLWNKGGFSALKPRYGKGREPALIDADFARLKADLSRSPREFGYGDAEMWTTELICRHLKEVYGVSYHKRYLYRLLPMKGITLTVPYPKARQQDPNVVAAFKKK